MVECVDDRFGFQEDSVESRSSTTSCLDVPSAASTAFPPGVLRPRGIHQPVVGRNVRLRFLFLWSSSSRTNGGAEGQIPPPSTTQTSGCCPLSP